ncbi:enoyl-CoA hydratase [Gemmobacter sp.]|uniref:enoyl-CoA hydratase n=1 Tax=Gemmobacter sp. TaxID=1898957 RepID=UPI002AFEB043|nr:enoyl-CoA hydratase [Gemmobacter sp.]
MSADTALILHDSPLPGIARLRLNRPQARNAQNLALLDALDDALLAAATDDTVQVIILAAEGKDFSAGHDLREGLFSLPPERFAPRVALGGQSAPGRAGHYAREREVYFDRIRRWRDIPKPTIAAVQGNCIAAGLMLAWACDLIIAAQDARFSDPVTAMGVAGVEWFAHPWELGARKAKELLMTGDPWSADEARAAGMVNHVVPTAELMGFTLALAARIAARPAFAQRMVKEAVNAAQDAQGMRNALETAFRIHQLCHAQNVEVHGAQGDPAGSTLRPGA